jgi:type IX secretion system PorP/SprF family membrane protein
MKKIGLLFLLLLPGMSALGQHNTYYSQYIYSGLLINPAYAGSQDALNITAAYRNQWTGFTGAPKSYSLAAHTPLRNKSTNLGILVNSENFGITAKTNLNVCYAYRIKFDKTSLAFGIQGGIDFLKNDWSLIKTTDQNDPSFVSQTETSTIPKFGAGIYYSGKNFYSGFSLPTLYRFDSKSTYSSIALNMYGGVLFRLKNDLVIKPSALVKYLPNSKLQWDITNTIYLNKIIGFGLGYRSNDAVYAFLDIRINEQFNLGYGYDFTTSQLKNYSAGSHEIMLRYLFKYNVNSKSIRYF